MDSIWYTTDAMHSSGDAQMADFLFEVGSLRKVLRAHRQTLLTDDLSDNIASHSFRVAMIGWLLAKQEGANPYKTVMMCLLHDVGETRSNDLNWVHKRYVSIFDNEIRDEQLGTPALSELHSLSQEYETRGSPEATLAKDADLIDQILLLKEYEHQGNKEATRWLYKDGEDTHRVERLQSATAKTLGRAIYERSPSDWWSHLSTSENRKVE